MGDQRQPRKTKVFLKEEEKLALHKKVFELANSGVKYGSAEIWQKAQDAVLKPERHVSYASLLNLSKEHDAILRSGKLGVKPAPHDHRPVSERGFVAVTPAPSPTPTPTTSPTPAPQPVVMSPPTSLGLFGHLDSVVSAYLGTIVAQKVEPIVKEIVEAIRVTRESVTELREAVGNIPTRVELVERVDAMIRRLETVEKSQADLIRMWGDSPAPTPTPAPAPGLSTTPPPAKRQVKVLAVPGDFVGPWDQLAKELPNATVVFGDDQKVETLPKGKEFDVVVVTYRTSAGARNRLSNHYTKQTLFLQREQHDTMLATIRDRVNAVHKLL